MEIGVLTGQEKGEAEARARTLRAIRLRAIATFGSSEGVLRQVEEIGLAIEAMSSGGAFGPAKTVSWEISA